MSENVPTEEENFVESITRPSLLRLARIAGVKTMSADCASILRTLLAEEAEAVCKTMLVFNSQRNTKTIMLEDLYPALGTQGCRLAKSEAISESICAAK